MLIGGIVVVFLVVMAGLIAWKKGMFASGPTEGQLACVATGCAKENFYCDIVCEKFKRAGEDAAKLHDCTTGCGSSAIAACKVGCMTSDLSQCVAKASAGGAGEHCASSSTDSCAIGVKAALKSGCKRGHKLAGL